MGEIVAQLTDLFHLCFEGDPVSIETWANGNYAYFVAKLGEHQLVDLIVVFGGSPALPFNFTAAEFGQTLFPSAFFAAFPAYGVCHRHFGMSDQGEQSGSDG